VGGDVLYASLKSIRTGVLIGLLTTLVTLPLAIFLGVSAGYFRGWIDDLIQYLYTTLSSIPGVLLIAAGVLMMQVMMDNHTDWFASTIERSDMRLLFLILILGVTSWTGLCRLLRAETLRISQMDFVTAAKAFGVSRWRIMARHIIPNLTHIILISVVLDFSGLVLAEAVLSYVGVGVDPTMYSWGNMINQARLEMAREPMVWWSLFSSFAFMFILVLAANLFSDRVQHVLDPRNV
jgi:peptide/nickel transport system permease protein